MYPEHLSIGSGGARGVVALGCLYILKKEGWLRRVHTFYGSSSGSIIAAGLVNGRSCKKMYKAVVSSPLVLQGGTWHHFGVHSGSTLITFIRAVTGIPKKMTFLELYQKTKKTLVVSVCNLTTKKTEQWSYKTHPNIPVLHALRISCSIPLLFQSVTHNGHVYVDGAVGDPVPATENPSRTLRIRFVNTKTTLQTIQDFFEALISVQNLCSTRFDISLDPGDIHSLAFSLEDAQAKKGFLCGKDQARSFIKKTM